MQACEDIQQNKGGFTKDFRHSLYKARHLWIYLGFKLMGSIYYYKLFNRIGPNNFGLAF